MSAIETDMHNGYGFRYADGVNCDVPSALFPDDARAIIDLASDEGNFLVVGVVGAGKSHLTVDMFHSALESGRPALALHTHINGGNKKGADNAMYVLDSFESEHGDEGVVVVDNVDYYGYSGQSGSRRYPLALAHIAVAERIGGMVEDRAGPIVCATAHTPDWRETHWRYSERRCDDQVTPRAAGLLTSFTRSTLFDGRLSEEIAANLLSQRMSDELDPAHIEEAVDAIREFAGGAIHYRHVKLLTPDGVRGNIWDALADIDSETERRLGGVAGKQTIKYA